MSTESSDEPTDPDKPSEPIEGELVYADEMPLILNDSPEERTSPFGLICRALHAVWSSEERKEGDHEGG